MSYIVVKSFSDLQDNKFHYRVGDVFPRPGFEVNKSRVNELMSYKNKRGVPLIREVPEDTSFVPEETPEDVETGETTIADLEAKERPRRSRKNNG